MMTTMNLQGNYVIGSNPEDALPYPASASFVMVTGKSVPVVAVAATFMVTVAVVELITLTLEKVPPLGPVTLAPATNPVPLMVAAVEVLRAAVSGLTFVSVGVPG
jgi:hypothetical protein